MDSYLTVDRRRDADAWKIINVDPTFVVTYWRSDWATVLSYCYVLFCRATSCHCHVTKSRADVTFPSDVTFHLHVTVPFSFHVTFLSDVCFHPTLRFVWHNILFGRCFFFHLMVTLSSDVTLHMTFHFGGGYSLSDVNFSSDVSFHPELRFVWRYIVVGR